MSARVDNLPPGILGEVAAGWSVELDAMPHSASQSSPSTGVVTFGAVADYDAHLAMNNSATFTYDDLDYSEVPDVLIGDSQVTVGYGRGLYGSGTYNGGTTVGAGTGNVQVWEPPGSLAISGQIVGTIDSVSLSGVTGSFTQGTGFSQFVTRDIYVPPVTSGSPLAAFNLAWQLAGNQPCSLNEPNSVYWALRGHDAGFSTKKNQYLAPSDLTTYRLASDGQTPFRKWDVRNSFSSTGWAVADGELWSTGGVGSSVLHQANRRTVLVATTDLNGRSTVIQFGSSTTDDNLGFGPDDAKASTGKWFSLAVHGPTASATLSGQYRAGGGYVTVNKTASLSGIDMTQPVQLVIDIGYPTSKSFTLTMYVQNVDTDLLPVTITTGLLNTALDVYSAPWKCTGYIHGLYVATHAYTSGYDPTGLLGPYEDWSPQPLCDVNNYGIGSPILAFSGSLWDYLSQVCIARQVGLRQSSGRFAMSAMSDDSIRAQEWHPAATPTFAIDNSSVAATVEIDAQFAKFGKAPRIYDALLNSDDYSVAPGTVGSFTINSTSINGLVYNPEPLADLNDFLNNSHPYGAYIVSGPDNLPIPVAEWISYGGSVSVAQTGLNTLTVTVTCPPIPISNATGDFFLGVSDASTSHPMLRLTSPAGGAVTDHPIIYETGASYAGASSTGASVSNIAATDAKSLQNTAAWAIVDAAGPNLTLSGSFPLEDLRQWDSSDFGLVPGATILYRNVQWRILTATISGVGIAFTAAPYTTYRSTYFAANWDGYTVDDFATFWEGKTYDDMATMVLAGPNFDWDSSGAVARYSLYPAGGIAHDDPGLDPSTTLLPSDLLDPDAAGADYTGIPSKVGIFPENADLFPGSEEDPI